MSEANAVALALLLGGGAGGLPAGKRSLHKCALRALVPERSQFLRIYQGDKLRTDSERLMLC